MKALTKLTKQQKFNDKNENKLIKFQNKTKLKPKSKIKGFNQKKHVIDQLEITGIDYQTNTINLKNNQYMKILNLGYFDTESSSDSEIQIKINAFEYFLRSLENVQVKLVMMDFPLNLTANKNHFKKFIAKHENQNSELGELTEQKLFEFDQLELRSKKTYYAFVFADDKNILKQSVDFVWRSLQNYVSVEETSFEDIIKVIYKLHNQNSELQFINGDIKFLHQNQTQFNFLEKISPKSGVDFQPKYAPFSKKGDGYETSLSFTAYPEVVSNNWLDVIHNVSNAIVTIDVKTESKITTKKNLNGAIKEQQLRAVTSQGIESYEARKALEETEVFFQNIANFGSAVNLVRVNIYLSKKSVKSLEEKVKSVSDTLEGVGFEVVNEMFQNRINFNNLFKSLTMQEAEASFFNKPYTKEIPSSTMAATIPFKHQSIIDDKGSYIGYTLSDGVIVLDNWLNDGKERLSYDKIFIGKKGSGKSTTMKIDFMSDVISGHKIFGVDAEGEYEALTNKLNGKYLYADGRNGILNPFQIRLSGKDDDNTKIDFNVEFNNHLAFLSSFMQTLYPTLSSVELMLFKEIFKLTYIKKGINESSNLLTLKPTEYPTFSDCWETFEFMANDEKNTYVSTYKEFKRLHIYIEQLCSIKGGTFATYFDGVTADDFDLINNQIVFFNIQSLINGNAENVFQAVFLNITSYFWSLFIANRLQNKDDDIKFFRLVLDEAQMIVNHQNPAAINFVSSIVRRARKYYAGVTLASQSIRDWVPEDGVSSAAFSTIKAMFENITYCHIMKQEDSSIPHMRKLFSTLTDSQLNDLIYFHQGECLLKIGSKSYHYLTRKASPEELELFNGGL